MAIFFVISGFLLYRPYASAHANERDMPDASRFYRHRVLRIFPAYWVAFTVFAFVLHFQAVHNARDGVLYYGLLQIYDRHRVLSGMGQTWSLGTELGFYLLVPVVAFAVHRFVMRSKGPQRVRIDVIAVACLFALGVAFRSWLVWVAPRSAGYALAWAPARLDWFALGMLMAVASTRSALSTRLGQAFTAVGAHAAAVWAVALGLFVVLCNLDLPRGFEPSTSGQIMGSYALLGLLAAAIVLPAVFGRQDHGVVRAALRSAPAVALGVISYGVFLWHMLLMRELVNQAHQRGVSPHFWQLLAAVAPLTIIVATASYFLVEKPALKLKDPGSATKLWGRVRHHLDRLAFR